jgi:peptidoglycan/xylan/chitin deacetylase (PgdA/CDA1 family)
MALCLMYHNFVEREADKARFEPAHRRYALTRDEFLAHLDAAAQLGWHCIRTGDLFDDDAATDPRALLLTFDDSWQEHLWAAGALRDRSITGVFFLNSGYLGQPGMLDAAGVKEMVALGQEIGSHGVTHDFFNSLDDAALRCTLMDSKAALETSCGRPIHYLSLPGGRLDNRTARFAMVAGYARTFTSRPGFLNSAPRRFLLNRLPITADITVERFKRLLRAPFPAVAFGRILYGVASISRMIRR